MTSERKVLPWLLIFAGALRVVFLLISVNATSDGPPRAIYAGEWAQHPVIVTHGHWLPLQLYLSGSLLMVWNNIWVAPRIISLVFGVATIWPLWRLTRLHFSETVSAATCVLFSLYGLHIAQSVVSSSEAVFLFLVLFALYHFSRWWQTQELPALVWSALFWLPAVWTKPEAWWLSAFSGLFVLTRIRRGFLPVVVYGVLLSIGPLLWFWACSASKGDALYTFHTTTAAVGDANRARPLWYRAAFWPVGLTLSLGPVVMLLALLGVIKALRERGPLLLLAFIAAFMVPFLATQFLADGGINARHTLFVGILLLPYACYWWEGRSPAQLVIAGIVWLLIILGLGETRHGEISQKFASISPRPKERWHVTGVTNWVRQHVKSTDRVVVDCFNDEESSLQYQVHLPPNQVRIYWNSRQSVANMLMPPPQFIVCAKRGAIPSAFNLDWNATTQTAQGLHLTRRYTNDVYAVFEVATGL